MTDTISVLQSLVRVDVKGAEQLARLDADMRKADDTARKFAKTLEALAVKKLPALSQLPTVPRMPSGGNNNADADRALRLAQAQARLLTTTGQLRDAQQTLQTALDGSTASELRQLGAANQLAAINNRLDGSSRSVTESFNRIESSAGGLSGKLNGLKAGFGALNSAAGALGIGLGAKAILDFGVEAGKGALELDRADKTLKAVAGGVEGYKNAIAAAKEQQVLFGGSLQENIAGISGLAITANQSGAELKKLIDLSQRLGALDPSQGVQGARIALSEGLSGDFTSLARRYEIPKTALRALADESVSTSGKLEIIDQYLNRIGVTSEAAAGSVSEQAKAFNRLGAAIDDAKNKLGEKLAGYFAPTAESGANLLGAGDNAAAANAAALKQASEEAQTYAQYQQQIATQQAAINQQIDATANGPGMALTNLFTKLGATIQPLTQDQYAYAMALVKTGSDAGVAIQKAQELGIAFDELRTRQQAASQMGNDGLADQIGALADKAAQVAAISPAAAANVQSLVNAFQNGSIGPEEFSQKLILVEGAMTRVVQKSAALAAADAYRKTELDYATQSAERHTAALGLDGDALEKQARQSLASTVQGQQLSQVQNTLANMGGQVASGHLTAGNGAIQLSNMYGIAIDKARELINLQAQIAGTKAQTKGYQDYRAGERGLINGNGVTSSQQERLLLIQQNEDKERQAALDRQILALGSVAEKQGVYNRQLADATRLYGANSKQAIDAKTALESYNQSLTRSGGSRGGGGARLSDQQKLNNKLTLDQMKFDDKAEDAETQHVKKLQDIDKESAKARLKIQEDFNEKMQAADAEYQQNAKDSRADFYESLASIKNPALQQDASARYEQIILESNRIKETQGSDAALKFQDAAIAALEKQLQLESKLAELRSTEGKDEGQIAEDANDARYLQDVLGLRREADNQRLDMIRQSGSDLANERDQQLTDEAAKTQEAYDNEAVRYQEAQDKIELASNRSTERRITNAQLEGKQIDANIGKVERLGDAYDRVGRSSGSTGAASGDTSTNTPSDTNAPQEAVQGASGITLLEKLEALLANGQEVVRAIKDNGSGTQRAISSLASNLR